MGRKVRAREKQSKMTTKKWRELCIMNGTKKRTENFLKGEDREKARVADCLCEIATGRNCSKRTRD